MIEARVRDIGVTPIYAFAGTPVTPRVAPVRIVRVSAYAGTARVYARARI